MQIKLLNNIVLYRCNNLKCKNINFLENFKKAAYYVFANHGDSSVFVSSVLGGSPQSCALNGLQFGNVGF